MLGEERSAVERKLGTGERVPHEHAAEFAVGPAQFEQEANQVAAIGGRHRFGQPVGHQGAVGAQLFDVGSSDLEVIAGRRVAKFEAVVRSPQLVALPDLAVGGRDGERGEPFLDLRAWARAATRPVSSGFRQSPARRQVGADIAPLPAGLMAREAGELGRSEQLGPTGTSPALAASELPSEGSYVVVRAAAGCRRR